MSSTTYIALLRGINVGSTRKLPMKDLVRILEGMGFKDVKTYIQSGNVVMRSDNHCSASQGEMIADAIEEERGFRPEVMLLEKSDITEAMERNPFPTTEGKCLHFFFLAQAPDAPDLETLESVKTDTEQFKLDGRVFYLYTPDGFGRSKLAEGVERSLGVGATARNLNTVTKLMELSAD